ncbi:uncharacterized protein PRD47_014951 [Ara ararauna]
MNPPLAAGSPGASLSSAAATLMLSPSPALSPALVIRASLFRFALCLAQREKNNAPLLLRVVVPGPASAAERWCRRGQREGLEPAQRRGAARGNVSGSAKKKKKRRKKKTHPPRCTEIGEEVMDVSCVPSG